MTDLRDDVLEAIRNEAARIDLELKDADLRFLTDAACAVFLQRVAKAITELRGLLESSLESAPVGAVGLFTPDTLLRYCDQMYPESSRQLLAAHAEAWIRDRDELVLRTGG